MEKGLSIPSCRTVAHSTVGTWGEENESMLQDWLLTYTREIILTVVHECLTSVYSGNITTASEIHFDILWALSLYLYVSVETLALRFLSWYLFWRAKTWPKFVSRGCSWDKIYLKRKSISFFYPLTPIYKPGTHPIYITGTPNIHTRNTQYTHWEHPWPLGCSPLQCTCYRSKNLGVKSEVTTHSVFPWWDTPRVLRKHVPFPPVT